MNMKSAWSTLKEKYLHIQFYSCTAHTLQLFVHDFECLQTFHCHHTKVKKKSSFSQINRPASVFLCCWKQLCILLTLNTTCPTWQSSAIKCLQKLSSLQGRFAVSCWRKSVSICLWDIQIDIFEEDAQAIQKLEGDKPIPADVTYEYPNI